MTQPTAQTEYLMNKSWNKIANFLLLLNSGIDRIAFHKARLMTSVRSPAETLSAAIYKIKISLNTSIQRKLILTMMSQMILMMKIMMMTTVIMMIKEIMIKPELMTIPIQTMTMIKSVRQLIKS